MPVTTAFNNIDAEAVSAVGISVADNDRDLVEVSRPLLAGHNKFHGNGAPKKGGGIRWAHGMNIGEHSNATRQRTGYEELDLTVSSVTVPFSQQPAECIYPVVISEKEVDDMGGGDAVYDVTKRRTQQAMNHAKRDWEKQALTGSVTGWDDFSTLNGTDNATGIVEEDARGSQGNTVGAFSKTTYALVAGGQNESFDFAGAANTNMISGLASLESNTMARRDAEMRAMCDIFSVTGFRFYKNILGGSERYAVVAGEGQQTALDGLSMNLLVGGVVAKPSIYMPNAGTTTATSPWTYLRLFLDGIYFCWGGADGTRDGYFGFREFVLVGGHQRVLVAPILVRGQWMVKDFAGTALGHDGEVF